MATVDLLVGLAVLVGLVGIVVPVLPGSILILGAVLVWALAHATTAGRNCSTPSLVEPCGRDLRSRRPRTSYSSSSTTSLLDPMPSRSTSTG